ncbi:MAG: ankyrin repeat domain-containing protein [Rhodocyclaceae bacterium]|nr:ankyrin repeat domain-containing protein [Rhodocyclaceae bacterium]
MHDPTEHTDSRRQRPQEWLLLILVTLMAIVANLPEALLAPLGVKPAYLVALLGFIVVLALFLYVRFFFFLLYVLLAIGANVPAQWAEALGIAQLPLLITLIAMVGLSLLNYAVKLLPTDTAPAPAVARKVSAEGTKALFAAVLRGNTQQLRQILSTGLDPNVVDAEGLTPLMHAARLGYAEMVEALLAAGADPARTDPRGQTARELALRKGNTAIVKLLSSPA